MDVSLPKPPITKCFREQSLGKSQQYSDSLEIGTVGSLYFMIGYKIDRKIWVELEDRYDQSSNAQIFTF